VLTHPPTVTVYVITEVPGLTPVTIPLEEPAVAIDATELAQAPPVVVLVHTAFEPLHIGVIPLIVWAIGAVTVTIFVPVFTHPPTVTVYVITEEPAVTPVTTPVVEPTVAIPAAELVQKPPGVVDIQAGEEPIQIGVIPIIVCAIGAVTVTVFVAVFTHPSIVTEYIITEVPAVIPLINPVEEPEVATVVVPLDQVPPLVVLVHVAVEFTQIGVVPLIV